MAEFQINKDLEEKKRMNNGYEIIDSCTIGSTELVTAYNPNENLYVCWQCKDGKDYFWGYYCNELSKARWNMVERLESTVRCMYDIVQSPPKSPKEHER